MTRPVSHLLSFIRDIEQECVILWGNHKMIATKLTYFNLLSSIHSFKADSG